MSRLKVRVEDALTAITAIALVVVLGGKSLGAIHLSENNFWDFSFILLPVAVLVLSASIRYAFRPIGAPAIRDVTAQTGSILRDWSPFLAFLVLYEGFRVNTWSVVSPVDKDALLLGWDRALLGETPSVAMDAWIQPWLTQIMIVAYFLHLILPPIVALIWYRRDLLVFRQFLLAILVSGVIGMNGYAFVPAIGPSLAFPSLYRHALSGGVYETVTSLLDTARAARDAFPSLHVGISSLVLWYSWRRGRALFFVMLPIVVANWVSTMYLRYHYFVDVMAGWLTAAASIILAAWLLRLEAVWATGGALRSTAPPPPSPR